MTLTPEQQKTIEDSLWVVNSALKEQGLSANTDLKQSAILYMCKCIQRFDPTKNIKWTTFAYKNIYLYIKRVNSKECIRGKYIVEQDIDDISYKIPIQDDDLPYKCQFGRVLGICTPEEKKFLQLKLCGYTINDISSILKCSRSKLSIMFHNIKVKARQMKDCEDSKPPIKSEKF